MGLVDEAISEFQTSAKSPDLFADSCSNLGVCFREKGMPKLAAKWYLKALENLTHEDDQFIGIQYDLGEAYVESGEKQKARDAFEDVYGLDANYREVSDKLQELEDGGD